MCQFHCERLDFNLLCANLLLGLIKQRLNNVGHLLFGIRIKIQLIELSQ